jgi:methionyl aminopeptidase
MIIIKNPEDINKMRESNRIVAFLLDEIEQYVKPGISTKELDSIAEKIIRSQGAKPSFKGYSVPGLPPFPGAICISINSGIVHGIPRDNVFLKEGDIVGIDVGAYKNGFHGDSARTYKVGGVSQQAEFLMKVTKEALDRGIAQSRSGSRIGDISYAIGSYVRENGFYVADSLTGHGIGRDLHEDPTVPNMGIKGRGVRLKAGMTIAIEPMVNIGTNKCYENGWEFFVADGSLSAHFEHTILITEAEPEILTIRG